MVYMFENYVQPANVSELGFLFWHYVIRQIKKVKAFIVRQVLLLNISLCSCNLFKVKHVKSDKI